MDINSKLFIVEFGKPDIGQYYFRSTQTPLFVIAKSYDEAAKKAIVFAENNSESNAVITPDGSLNINNDQLTVKAVRLACDEIVW